MILQSLSSLSTRCAIAVAAVVLTALEAVGLADLAEPDIRTVMLDRVVVEAQRDLISTSIAQRAAGRCETGAGC